MHFTLFGVLIEDLVAFSLARVINNLSVTEQFLKKFWRSA